MAIGDSLLNGMRSYSITDALAARAVPALLAAALSDAQAGQKFRRAHYPAPHSILLDVEETLRAMPAPLPAALLALPDVFRAIDANARAWLARFAAAPDAAMPLMFDNIAIAGAEDADVYDESAAGFAAIAGAFATLTGGPKPRPLAWEAAFPHAAFPRVDADGAPRRTLGIADLHIALNARHLLNPRNEPALMGLRAIDHVALRRPRILLHSLGHNSGLFDITMNERPERGLAALWRFARERWPVQARMLAALPGAVEHVVVQLLPLPGQVPNLMPRMTQPNPLQGGYFAHTMAAFRVPRAAGTLIYSRSDMARFDAEVAAVNAAIRAAAESAFAATPARLVMFDIPAIMQRYDAKHGHGQAVRVSDQAGVRRFTNHGFARYRGGGEGSEGGLCSLDNHHPSTLGYRLFARELALLLNTVRPGLFDATKLAVTDEDDTLLKAPPRLGLALLKALHAITTHQASGNGQPGALAQISQGAPGRLARLVALAARGS